MCRQRRVFLDDCERDRRAGRPSTHHDVDLDGGARHLHETNKD